MNDLKSRALAYHEHPRPGKVSVEPSKPCLTQDDLSLAYTPGVAEPVRAIAAGCDAVLVCSADYGGQSATLEALVHAVEDGRLSRRRVEDALRCTGDLGPDAVAGDQGDCVASQRTHRLRIAISEPGARSRDPLRSGGEVRRRRRR